MSFLSFSINQLSKFTKFYNILQYLLLYFQGVHGTGCTEAKNDLLMECGGIFRSNLHTINYKFVWQKLVSTMRTLLFVLCRISMNSKPRLFSVISYDHRGFTHLAHSCFIACAKYHDKVTVEFKIFFLVLHFNCCLIRQQNQPQIFAIVQAVHLTWKTNI